MPIINYPGAQLVIARVFYRNAIINPDMCKFNAPSITLTFEDKKRRDIVEIRVFPHGGASVEKLTLFDFDREKSRWTTYGAAMSESYDKKQAQKIARDMLALIDASKLIKYSGSSFVHESYYLN